MMKIVDTFNNEQKMTRQYRAYDNDDGISKPTTEQYENSKKMKAMLAESLHCSKKRQEELLDALFDERQAEKDYRGFYEAHRDIVRRYEIYQEIEANG